MNIITERIRLWFNRNLVGDDPSPEYSAFDRESGLGRIGIPEENQPVPEVRIYIVRPSRSTDYICGVYDTLEQAEANQHDGEDDEIVSYILNREST